MASDVQVNLRLPVELKEKLHEIAKNNNRSLNIELNERLINSFAQTNNSNHARLIKDLNEFFSSYQQSPRLIDISQRLQFALSESNQLRDSKKLNPSLIAYELGFESASEVENWFDGRLEPTFEQLKLLAKLLGCSEEWLLFGMGKPYPLKSAPSALNVSTLLKFCFEIEPGYDKIVNLYFVRNDSKEGEILIIKQFTNNACQVYDTNLHLSDVVGDGGRNQRAEFVLALYALSKMDFKYKSYSYLIDDANFMKLQAGDEHPLKNLFKFRYAEWMDDIYDKSMFDRFSYWDGWEILCSNIYNDIERDEKLLAEKNLIRTKEHEIFSALK